VFGLNGQIAATVGQVFLEVSRLPSRNMMVFTLQARRRPDSSVAQVR
jgi:hypothetical protein